MWWPSNTRKTSSFVFKKLYWKVNIRQFDVNSKIQILPNKNNFCQESIYLNKCIEKIRKLNLPPSPTKQCTSIKQIYFFNNFCSGKKRKTICGNYCLISRRFNFLRRLKVRVGGCACNFFGQCIHSVGIYFCLFETGFENKVNLDQRKNQKYRVSSYFHSSHSHISSPVGQFSDPAGHSLTLS